MVFSKHELEVMTVFWNHDEGLTHVELLELSPQRSWKDSTIHTLINGLLHKDAIRQIGKKPSGRRFSRIFKSAMTAEEYGTTQVQNVISNVQDLQLINVVSAFVEARPISNEERNELIALLSKMEE